MFGKLKQAIVSPTALFFGIAITLSLPAFLKYPGTDQGVFLYTAERLLHGDLLYRDVWDHKGPVLYLFEILALLVGRSSYWGVGIISFFITFFLLLAHYTLLKKYVSRSVACLGTLGVGCLLGYWLRGGNVPSFYALFLESFLLLLACNSFTKKTFFAAGVLQGLLFFIKPTFVGMGTAILVYWAYLLRKDIPKLISAYGWSLAGFVSIAAPIVGYFFYHHSLGLFFDTYLIFNFSHATTSLDEAVDSTSLLARWVAFAHHIFLSPILLTSFLGWLGVVYVFLKKRLLESIRPLTFLAIILFPIEVFLSNFTLYKPFYHYQITVILPILLIATIAIVASRITIPHELIKRYAFLPITIIAIIFLALGIPRIRTHVQTIFSEQQPLREIVDYIKSNSNPDDSILVWGSKATLNFMSARKAPSRYSYMSPIFFIHHVHAKNMMLEFTEDVTEKRPKLIIYAMPGGMYSLERGAGLEACEQSNARCSLKNFYIFVSDNYTQTTSIGNFVI